ncbi:MAG: acyltransferase [Pseudomonadota bacterium]
MRIDTLISYLRLHYLLWKKRVPEQYLGKRLSIKPGLRLYVGKKCRAFVIHDDVKINRNVDMEVGQALSIGAGSVIGVGCFLQADGEIRIGTGVLLAPQVKIFSTSHTYGREGEIHNPLIKGSVIIEDNVWVGAGTVIALNVRIGRNAVIGANSFVNRDIPENVVAVGTPARVIRAF